MGTPAPVPPDEPAPGIALSAGAIETTWCEGRLGRVTVDGHEVWHGVHFLLRDAHWRTPSLWLGAPQVEALSGTAGAWRLVAEGWFDGSDAVRLRIIVEGHAAGGGAGHLVVTGEAHVARDVEVNRLGLCLLHPLSACGRALEIHHDDGRLTRSTFPELVCAWPPFNAIRSMRHEYAPAAWALAEFEGDVFELEDQRNNADASFKTYSRSNFMPRPYRLRAGDVVRQRVRLQADRAVAPRPLPLQGLSPVQAMRPVAWPARASVAAAPARVGVEVTADDLAAAGRPGSEVAATLAALRPDHLHVTLPGLGTEPDLRPLPGLLAAAGPQADLRLDLVDLPDTGAAAVVELLGRRVREAGLAPGAGTPARRWDVAVFPSTAEAVQAARTAFPGARIGGGTHDFFVQLNRAERLPPLDFIGFTVCPIVHAADDETVMLGHASLAGMRATLEARHPGVPVHLGPSSIAARRSPLGELAPSDGTRRVPLAGLDPREHTAFGAAWVAAHVAAALAAGVRVLTVSRLALCGAGSPTGALLAQLGRRVRPDGLHPLPALHGAVRALDLDGPDGREIVWINTTAEASTLVLPEGLGVRWRIGVEPLGDDAREGGTLTLGPYALAAVGALRVAGAVSADVSRAP